MQNRAWIFVPQGCALASAFRKPRTGLPGGRCLGLGPSSTADLLCHACHRSGPWLPCLQNG